MAQSAVICNDTLDAGCNLNVLVLVTGYMRVMSRGWWLMVGLRRMGCGGGVGVVGGEGIIPVHMHRMHRWHDPREVRGTILGNPVAQQFERLLTYSTDRVCALVKIYTCRSSQYTCNRVVPQSLWQPVKVSKPGGVHLAGRISFYLVPALLSSSAVPYRASSEMLTRGCLAIRRR